MTNAFDASDMSERDMLYDMVRRFATEHIAPRAMTR